jgi:hypothetical protein
MGRVFDASSDQFAPSTSAFMINYAVDDMDTMCGASSSTA